MYNTFFLFLIRFVSFRFGVLCDICVFWFPTRTMFVYNIFLQQYFTFGVCDVLRLERTICGDGWKQLHCDLLIFSQESSLGEASPCHFVCKSEIEQFSTSYPHMTCGLPSVIAPRLGGSPICVATCWKVSHFEMMKVRREGLSTSLKNRKWRGFIFRHHRTWHLTYLQAKEKFPSSGKYKVLGLNRDLLTDILTVCRDLWMYFRCLQLREVLCRLPMLYLLRFYVYLPDIKPSILFILASFVIFINLISIEIRLSSPKL